MGHLFEKGNKVAVGHKPKKAYLQVCRDFAEDEGWEKLFRWARSKNPKASLSALTLIFAYAYGKPKEQIKLDGTFPVTLQQLILNVFAGRANAGNDNSSGALLPLSDTSGTGLVREGSPGVGEVVEQTNGHRNGDSGQPTGNGEGMRG